jgi:hypothetical protein
MWMRQRTGSLILPDNARALQGFFQTDSFNSFAARIAFSNLNRLCEVINFRTPDA